MFLFLLIAFIGLSFDRLNVFKYCLLSCLLHETGHIVAYRYFTGNWPQIDVKPFGFTMKNNVTLNKYFTIILFSGPAVNLICAATAFLFLNRIITIGRYVFFIINSFMFIFNMLPVYYLDGGQILYTKSLIYQKNYNIISSFALFVFCVMLYTFTDDIALFLTPVLYFVLNKSNDI